MSNQNSNHSAISISMMIFLFCLVVVFAYDYLGLVAILLLILLLVFVFIRFAIYLLVVWQEYQAILDKRYLDRIMIAPRDNQIISVERSRHGIIHKKVHLSPKVYSNGSYEEPLPSEWMAYEAFHKRHSSNNPPLMIEQSSPSEKRRTIFDVVDTSIHISIIGPTGTGKTSLASHIIDHLSYTKTYILSPHFHIDKLDGTWTDNGEPVQKYDNISSIIQSTFTEMVHRYDNAIRSDKNILLVLDEFVSIIEEVDCEQALSRIAREGRKVGVRLLFMSQTDQISDIGFSVATRRNFTRIELSRELTGQNQATIKHWDKSIEIIELAGPYEKKMTLEKRVLELWEKSDKSEQAITAIAKQVYASYGGNQRNTVKRIIKNGY